MEVRQQLGREWTESEVFKFFLRDPINKIEYQFEDELEQTANFTSMITNLQENL